MGPPMITRRSTSSMAGRGSRRKRRVRVSACPLASAYRTMAPGPSNGTCSIVCMRIGFAFFVNGSCRMNPSCNSDAEVSPGRSDDGKTNGRCALNGGWRGFPRRLPHGIMVCNVKDRVLPATKMQISWMCAMRFGNGGSHALDDIGSEKSGPLIRAAARSCAPGRAAREGTPFSTSSASSAPKPEPPRPQPAGPCSWSRPGRGSRRSRPPRG
ncbi:hypothetical protein DSECCO2_657210 [anaerobic digester metagenome]